MRPLTAILLLLSVTVWGAEPRPPQRLFREGRPAFSSADEFETAMGKLGENDTVVFSGNERFKLGSKIHEGSQFVIFEIQGKPDQVLKLAKDPMKRRVLNELSSGTRALEAQHVPVPKVLASRDGEFVVQQRVRDPVSFAEFSGGTVDEAAPEGGGVAFEFDIDMDGDGSSEKSGASGVQELFEFTLDGDDMDGGAAPTRQEMSRAFERFMRDTAHLERIGNFTEKDLVYDPASKRWLIIDFSVDVIEAPERAPDALPSVKHAMTEGFLSKYLAFEQQPGGAGKFKAKTPTYEWMEAVVNKGHRDIMGVRIAGDCVKNALKSVR
jgi:hypothetical protein